MNIGLIPLSGNFAVRSNNQVSASRDTESACHTKKRDQTGYTPSNHQMDTTGSGNSAANVKQLMTMMMSMMMMMMQMMMKVRGGNVNVPPQPNHPPQPGHETPVLGDAPKPVIDPAKIDYNKDTDLKQRQHDLIGGRNDDLDALMGIVDNSGPTSPKTKEALAKINKFWTDAKGDAGALKEYNAIQSLRENNSVTAQLHEEVEEANDAADEKEAELKKHQDLHNNLVDQIKKSRGGKETGNTKPVQVDFMKDASLKARQHQLLKGKSTEIDKLLDTIDNTNPESPEGEAAEKKLAELWGKSNGDPKALSEYTTLQNIRQSNSLLGSLTNVQKELEPNSEEYKGVENRMVKIREAREADIKKAKEFQAA